MLIPSDAFGQNIKEPNGSMKTEMSNNEILKMTNDKISLYNDKIARYEQEKTYFN